MSSHHFVKEGQEPALLIATEIPWNTIEGLLEWSPFIIASGDALEKILSWGIRIDAVIVDDGRAIEQAAEEQFTHLVAPIPGESIIRTGLAFLLKKGYTNVNIVSSAPGEAAKEAEKMFSEIRPVLLDANHRWTPVRGGFEKWFPAGSRLKLGLNGEQHELMVNDLTVFRSEFIAESDGILKIFSRNLVWIGELI